MTVLALRLSALANGGQQTSRKGRQKPLESYLPRPTGCRGSYISCYKWRHIWTWLNPNLVKVLDKYLPVGWHEKVYDPEVWEAVDKNTRRGDLGITCR